MNIKTEHESSHSAFQMSTNTSRGVYQHQRYPVNGYQWYGSSIRPGGGHNFPQSTSGLNQQHARWTPGHGNGITELPNKGNYGYYNYTNEVISYLTPTPIPTPVLMTYGFKRCEASHFPTEN
ncbi:hypothetical protein R6Q59_032533 [Mikania micrantha]|uniref:Uncharacterized protein n=1 Tax=Mikania micrantha TaxID=192012 RepID=A0A5N6NSU7_9ASTR|nr:hypothetical protein E3N88_17149 [Mikania micrantha]